MAEGKIYQKMVAVMQQIGGIGKNNTNTFHKYKFRGIDDVYNALHKPLAENGVFILPEVLRHEVTPIDSGGKTSCHAKLVVKFHFVADDGSRVESTAAGEGIDTGDKATNKAMSAAFKYSILETFCIPTEGELDADAESPYAGKPKTEKPKPAKPDYPTMINAKCDELDKNPDDCYRYFEDKFNMPRADFLEKEFKEILNFLSAKKRKDA